jgi:hypothetical protein
MAERTKATVLKTVSGATRSWVRIPLLPPKPSDDRLSLQSEGACAHGRKALASSEVHDERGVIARLALTGRGFAFVPIHEHLAATLRDRPRPEREVEPEPPAAVERSRSVVPPREWPGACLMQAEEIDQSQSRSDPTRSRSASLQRLEPRQSTGSCTSRSSGATLKSPTMRSGSFGSCSARIHAVRASSHLSFTS